MHRHTPRHTHTHAHTRTHTHTLCAAPRHAWANAGATWSCQLGVTGNRGRDSPAPRALCRRPDRVSYGTTRPSPGFVLGTGYLSPQARKPLASDATQGSWVPSQLQGEDRGRQPLPPGSTISTDQRAPTPVRRAKWSPPHVKMHESCQNVLLPSLPLLLLPMPSLPLLLPC